MMDGLDPSPPKNYGHDSLVATLLVERKTCCHLAQAPQCPSPSPLQQARVSLPLEVTMEHEVHVNAFKS
jgi:hypothetical protein